MEKRNAPAQAFVFSKPELEDNTFQLYQMYKAQPGRFAETEQRITPNQGQLFRGIMPYFLMSALGALIFFVILWLTEDAKVDVSDSVINAFAMGIIAWWAGIVWGLWKSVKGFLAFNKKKTLVRKYFNDFSDLAKSSTTWQSFGKKWFETKDSYYFKAWRRYWIEKKEWIETEEKNENKIVIARGHKLFGQKEGLWEVFKPTGMYLREEFYENGEMIWSPQLKKD